MNITTRTTIVSNVQFDDNIRIWLLEEEGFKSTPETWKFIGFQLRPVSACFACRVRLASDAVSENDQICCGPAGGLV